MRKKLGNDGLSGQFYSFQGNKPLLLNEPYTLWIIKSGSVAVFNVKVEDNEIKGMRRYLFSCSTEEVLWGTISSFGKKDCLMLAVPIEKTELLKVDRDCVSQLIATADKRIEVWINSWLKKLSTVISTVIAPEIEIRKSKQGEISLVNGQAFQPDSDTVIWITVQQGYGRWLGLEEFTITPITGAIPLTNTMWIEADGTTQLKIANTNLMPEANTIISGITWLHRQIFCWIKSQEKQKHSEELEHLQKRRNLDLLATKEAFKKLVSPLSFQEKSTIREENSVLVVAGAVGKALGVPISSPTFPGSCKKLKESLEAIAQASRLRIRQVVLEDEWWEKDCGPMVAYSQRNQTPVALIPVTLNSYEMLVPGVKFRIPIDANSASELALSAYVFYRTLPDKIINITDVIWFAFYRRGKDLMLFILTGIAATLLGILTPYATGIIVDSVIPDREKNLLLQIGSGLLIAAVGTAIFSFCLRFYLIRVKTISDVSTQAAIWDRLLNLPVSFFRQYTTGDLQSRVNSVYAIRRQLSGVTLINLVSGLFSLMYLGLLLYYDFGLALVAVAIAVVVTIFTSLSGIIMMRKIYPLLKIKGIVFGLTVQLINGISKLRIAGAEERAFAFWTRYYSQQIELELSTQLVEDIVAIFNTVMPTLTSAILFWFAHGLLIETKNTSEVGITIGSFIGFYTAYTIFIKSATNVSNTIVSVLQIIPHGRRTEPILKTMPESSSDKADPGELVGKVDVNHVSFRYNLDSSFILQDITIHAEPGEFIALVGQSGSGKSTILRLLLGFEIPESGKIYYDDKALSGLNVSAVRRQLGVVLQNGRVMSGSIFENISGGVQITLNEAWEALEMAGLANDVAAMPTKIHTLISEAGGNLSGGQIQRLLIARALVRKPHILLLDEATSALDNHTQAIISKNLDRIKVTRIVIAHRLSTIRNADHIYVFEKGEVVQQGSFDELISDEGLFADLMCRQMP